MSSPLKPLVRRLLSRGKSAVSRAGGEALSRLRPERPSLPAEIHFSGRASASAERGETVLAAAVRMDVELDHFCGGQCSCGTCRIEVLSGAEHLSPMEGGEELVLGVARDRGSRLACQARILGPVSVRIPEGFNP